MAAEGGLRREEEFLPDVKYSDEDEEEEEEDFLPDFKKYMKRKLNFSRLKLSHDDCQFRGWVFWNQQDDYPFGRFLNPFEDPIPDICPSLKVRLRIRHVLHKLVMLPDLYKVLIQFWAPTKTPEGQTLLKSQNQPFALSGYVTEERDNLCKYRMAMSEEYPYFHADAKCSEKQLGLPGRVFLHQFTECNSQVYLYSEEEYPQLELALRCDITKSWALPVFEHSSRSCLGVIEIVSSSKPLWQYYGYRLIRDLCDIFKEFDLLCFDGCGHLNMEWKGRKEATWDASSELWLILQSVCKTHSLPLALTWLSCGWCSDVLENVQNWNGLSKYFDPKNRDRERHHLYRDLEDLIGASTPCLLKKGQFTGRMLSFPNLLYRSDVRQFSIAEYPLVPWARKCELSGCFTMCLQSSYTRDELYVLELFFPASNINNKNLLTTLRLILTTMEEHSKTFKLASGQGLGEELPVEVMNFENGQKRHSVEIIPTMDAINNPMCAISEAQMCNMPSLESLQNEEVTTQLDSSHQVSMVPSNEGHNNITLALNNRVASISKTGKRKMKDTEHEKAGVRIDVSLEEIRKCSQMTRHDAAKKLKVGVSTLKRLCRDYGIPRWPPRDIENLPVEGHTPQLNSDLPSNEASGSVADTTIRFQDADKVTIRATYETINIRFHLSLSSKLLDLQEEVAKRLNLKAGTYYIEYKHKEDKEEELTLIACDDDLQYCIHYFRSLEITSILLHLRGLLPKMTST